MREWKVGDMQNRSDFAFFEADLFRLRATHTQSIFLVQFVWWRLASDRSDSPYFFRLTSKVGEIGDNLTRSLSWTIWAPVSPKTSTAPHGRYRIWNELHLQIHTNEFICEREM